ncbi:MAG: translation elongation factor Ts [bacterium]
MNIEEIKKLRQETGAGFTECKKAYEEAGEDFQKTLEILKGEAEKRAERKAERQIKAGLVSSYIHGSGKMGALLKVGCETDFVAKNEEFQKMVRDIAMHIVAMNPQNEEELLAQPFVKNPDITIKDYIQGAITRIGENIKIEQFVRFEV